MKQGRTRVKVIRRKHDEAAVRQEARAARTDEQQITKLNGGGYVAVKERARLQSRIDIKKRIVDNQANRAALKGK